MNKIEIIKTLQGLMSYFEATHYDYEDDYVILYDDDYMTIAEIFEDEHINNVDVKEVFNDIRNQL